MKEQGKNMKLVAHQTAGELRPYLSDFFRHAGIRSISAIGLLIIVGLTEGVGLLMLIPFLQLIGLTDSSPNGMVLVIQRGWEFMGLPMNLASVLAVWVAVVSTYAVVSRFSTLVNARISHSFTRHLRNELCRAMTHAEWLHFTRARSADINHMMTANLNTVDNGSFGLFMLISTLLVVAVHIGVALALSVPMTCIAMASSVILLMIMRPLNRKSYILGEDWRRTMNNLFGELAEYLGAMKPAKSFGVEDQHEKQFSMLTSDLETQANRFAGVLASTQMWHEIGGVLLLGVFFYTARELLDMPAAPLLMMIYLFARIVPQFSWMQRTWQGILNMLPAYTSVIEMTERFRSAAEPPAAGTIEAVDLKHSVEFIDVDFGYEKSENSRIIKNLDVSFPAFQTTVILGPSGGGKSTMADLLIGLLRPDEGRILIDGVELDGGILHGWRRSVAYVPQESILFHDTIRANLLWARPEAGDEEIWEALGLAAAEEFIRRLPDGLDTVVGDRGVRLSGGERQRISLARALLRKPTLLLLDEATSQLDLENERQILDALAALRGKMTIVFISHRLSAARCADRVVTMQAGKLISRNEPDSIAELPQEVWSGKRSLRAAN